MNLKDMCIEIVAKFYFPVKYLTDDLFDDIMIYRKKKIHDELENRVEKFIWSWTTKQISFTNIGYKKKLFCYDINFNWLYLNNTETDICCLCNKNHYFEIKKSRSEGSGSGTSKSEGSGNVVRSKNFWYGYTQKMLFS